jgi:phospholipid/cholesterol/gamma-HCH transport system substrate-binding protein
MNGASRISWSQVRVGLAVFVALIVLAVAIFFIGETGAIFGERYQLTTLMPSANGLIEGANVRLAGQDVGKVEDISFVPVAERRHPDHVLRITLAIDRAVAEQIRHDSEARIRTQGLLGDKVIDVTPGTPDASVLAEGDTLPSSVAADYEQMLASASALVDDLAVMLPLAYGHNAIRRAAQYVTLAEQLSRCRGPRRRRTGTARPGRCALR